MSKMKRHDSAFFNIVTLGTRQRQQSSNLKRPMMLPRATNRSTHAPRCTHHVALNAPGSPKNLECGRDLGLRTRQTEYVARAQGHVRLDGEFDLVIAAQGNRLRARLGAQLQAGKRAARSDTVYRYSHPMQLRIGNG